MMARSFTQINIIYFKGLSNSRMSTFMERFNSIVKKLTDESYGLAALLAALVVQVEEMLAKILFIPPINVNSIKAVKMSNR